MSNIELGKLASLLFENWLEKKHPWYGRITGGIVILIILAALIAITLIALGKLPFRAIGLVLVAYVLSVFVNAIVRGVYAQEYADELKSK